MYNTVHAWDAAAVVTSTLVLLRLLLMRQLRLLLLFCVPTDVAEACTPTTVPGFVWRPVHLSPTQHREEEQCVQLMQRR
jgi:hypothetical protein